jgi:hypothetical protein
VENFVSSKPEGKVDSLPMLGHKFATSGTPTREMDVKNRPEFHF